MCASVGGLEETYWYVRERLQLEYEPHGVLYLFLSGDGWGEHEVYEARGTDYGIVHRWRTVYSGAEITKGIRRTGLIENIGVTEHIIEADDEKTACSLALSSLAVGNVRTHTLPAFTLEEMKEEILPNVQTPYDLIRDGQE